MLSFMRSVGDGQAGSVTETTVTPCLRSSDLIIAASRADLVTRDNENTSTWVKMRSGDRAAVRSRFSEGRGMPSSPPSPSSTYQPTISIPFA